MDKIKIKEKYYIGIVGFGGAGMALYKHFESFDDCSVISVFDIKEPAFERARNHRADLFLTSDFDAFLESGIDIVVVSSPDSTHAKYICRSVEHGKHVLCEKPLTDSVEGIRDILKCVKAHPDIVVGVQHQMRCLPIHRKIKDIVSSGVLGKVGYIEGYYVHNLTKRAFEYDNWRLVENATPLIYSGIHFVDLLRWVVDDEIVEVSAMANNICFPEYPESDLNVVLLKFRSGIIGKVVTAFGAGRPQDHTVQVYGNDKSIFNNMLFDKDGSFEIFATPIRNTMQGRKLAWIKETVIATYSKLFEWLMRSYPYNAQYNIGYYPIRLYEHSMAVRNSAENFMNTVKGKGKLDCTVFDAARSVVVALAGVEAYRTGKTVVLKDFGMNDIEELL